MHIDPSLDLSSEDEVRISVIGELKLVRVESLYARDISTITFVDVKEFCDLKLRESLRIDYKRDFPSELERIIASFANTAGGIILIGVETDDANKPSQIVGVEYIKGLEERVLNICHSNTSPPITPEVIVCPYSSTGGDTPDRCVMMVRVQESSEAPHFIGKKRNLIYIRVDNECEQADADSIRHLMTRHEKGIERRTKALETRMLVSPLPPQIAGIPEFPNWQTTQLIVVPASMTRSMTEFTQETDRMLSRLPQGYLQFGDENPKQNGIEWYFKSDESEYFAEVTHEGLFQYKEGHKTGDALYFSLVVQLIYDATNFALAMYKAFAFTGRVIVSLALDGTRNRRLATQPSYLMRGSYVCASVSVVVQKEVGLDELALDPIAIVVGMFLDFARAFKWSMSRDEATRIVRSCLKQPGAGIQS